jgi:tRNA nucleotidyltransferase (CCA-adding enzyme)
VAPHAERGLELMRRTGLLAVVLPAVAALPAREQRHSFAGVESLPPEPELRFAWLLHRAASPAEGARILFDLRMARRISDAAGELLRLHACPRARARLDEPAEGGALRRWLAAGGRERWRELVSLRAVEAASLPLRARGAARRSVRAFDWRVERELAKGPPLSVGELALDGLALMEIIGAEPGTWVGEALRHLLERVLDDPGLNSPAALTAVARDWWTHREPLSR